MFKHTLLVIIATFYSFCLLAIGSQQWIPEVPGAFYGLEVELHWKYRLPYLTKYYEFDNNETRRVYLRLISQVATDKIKNGGDHYKRYLLKLIDDYLLNNPQAFLDFSRQSQEALYEGVPTQHDQLSFNHIYTPDGEQLIINGQDHGPFFSYIGTDSTVWNKILKNWSNLSYEEKFSLVDLNNLNSKSKAKVWHGTSIDFIHTIFPKKEIGTEFFELLSRIKFHKDQDALEATYFTPVTSVNQYYKDLILFSKLAGIESYIANPQNHRTDPLPWGSMHTHMSTQEHFPYALFFMLNINEQLNRFQFNDYGGINPERNLEFNVDFNFNFNITNRGLLRILSSKRIFTYSDYTGFNEFTGSHHEQRYHSKPLFQELKFKNELFLMTADQQFEVIFSQIKKILDLKPTQDFVHRHNPSNVETPTAALIRVVLELSQGDPLEMIIDTFNGLLDSQFKSPYTHPKELTTNVYYLRLVNLFLTKNQLTTLLNSILTEELANKLKETHNNRSVADIQRVILSSFLESLDIRSENFIFLMNIIENTLTDYSMTPSAPVEDRSKNRLLDAIEQQISSKNIVQLIPVLKNKAKELFVQNKNEGSFPKRELLLLDIISIIRHIDTPDVTDFLISMKVYKEYFQPDWLIYQTNLTAIQFLEQHNIKPKFISNMESILDLLFKNNLSPGLLKNLQKLIENMIMQAYNEERIHKYVLEAIAIAIEKTENIGHTNVVAHSLRPHLNLLKLRHKLNLNIPSLACSEIVPQK